MRAFPTYRSHTRAQLRSFGLLIAALTLAGVAFTFYRAQWTWSNGHSIAVAIAALAAGIGVALPELLRPLFHPWMVIGVAIGAVMSRVVLTLFFFLVVTPIGLILRALGRRPLDLGGRAGGSYWRTREGPAVDPARDFARTFSSAKTRPITGQSTDRDA